MTEYHNYPALDECIKKGWVWVEDSTIDGIAEYLGKAKDGTIVNMGIVGEESALERYLSEMMSPDLW